MIYKPMRRTFEAAKYPVGSADRTRLNCDPLTSEYMPSYRYVVRGENGEKTPYSHRTKAEAETCAQRLNYPLVVQ